MVTPTIMDWNHMPTSEPSSISIRVSFSPDSMEDMSMLVLPTTTPEALFTTCCATSKTAITMFHVF